MLVKNSKNFKKMSKSKILIAASPSLSPRYRQAVENGGFHAIHPFIKSPESFPAFSDLLSLSFDLLLLPGGGDISPGLYNQKNLGSNKPDYEVDLLQFQLLQLAVIKRKPILGICKGMQMINVFFGGGLCQQLPTATIHSTPDSDCYHKLYFPPAFPHQSLQHDMHFTKNLYRLLSDYPIVNSAHHQGISPLGKNLFCIQHTEDSVPETILHRFLPVLGLQWHPERLPDFCGRPFAQLLQLLLTLH